MVPIPWICPSIISLTRSEYWRVIRYPGLLRLYLTLCWSVPQFSAWNIPTGTTAFISNYCSETFPGISLPSKSNPSSFANSGKSSMPNFASSQGQVLTIILHHGFLHRSMARHSTPSAQNPFLGAFNVFDPLLATPSLDAAF